MWRSGPTSGGLRPSRRGFLLTAAGVAGAAAVLAPTRFTAPARAQGPTWLVPEHPAFSVGATVGGLTFVAQDASGPGGPPAGTRAQAERTLENLGRALAAAGQRPDDLVFLEVLLTDYAAAPEVARLVQAAFRPDRAPTTCFLGVSGLGPGRLVRMDAVASSNPDRAQIVAPGLPLPLGAPCHAVRSGDLVFVGGLDAPEIDGPADTGEEHTAQSALILDRMDAVLRAGGLSLGDAFRHFTFLRHMDEASVRDAYSRGRGLRLEAIFGPDEFPANSRIGVPALEPGVAQRACALATPGPREYVASIFARRTPGIFAQSVRVGNWLFIAGQDAVDVAQQTMFLGDLHSQTEQCLRQTQWIVEAAGGTLDDVVKTTVYLLDGQPRAVFLDAYGEYFRRRLKSPWMPTGLTMDVESLRPGCLVEIDSVAWLGPR